MEVFTELKPSALLIRPLPLNRFRDFRTIYEERCNQLVNIARMHNTPAQMHMKISESNQQRGTKAQKMCNAKTIVSAINIEACDYVMIRRHAKKDHKLQARWKGQVHVTKAKSHLVLEVKGINDTCQFVVHACA